MYTNQTRFPVRIAAGAIAALLLFAAAARAATITVEFKPEEGKPAEYQKVYITLLPRGGHDAISHTVDTSREKAFTHTFRDLPTGSYMVMTSAGSPTFAEAPDVKTPGLYRHGFSTDLKEDESQQTVKVQYKYFDPGSLAGDMTYRGEILTSAGKAVAGVELKILGQTPWAGTVVVGRATTGEDGRFEVGGLSKSGPFRAYSPKYELGAELLEGKPATLRLAPVAGDVAPDVELVRLTDGKTVRLSDFKGKVVVLDFWATWCGPCQPAMAKMQTYREMHPEWADKVELIAVSIDDEKETAVKHLAKNGWDKTYNAWAGEGGFKARPPVFFGVTGIPQAYVIDQKGKVAAAGHPMSLEMSEVVGGLLARE